MAPTYTAKDITVLEGLEPVRKRPGMYIGGVGAPGLHHLVWEILDNAVDEAMNGHASSIGVTLHADGASVTVTDDGRGIPVDRHAKTRKSAMEVIFTTLHAGGKFEHRTYKTAGGLHGVGASVVNALSKELIATSKRDGAQWQQRFKQGKPVGPVKKLGAARGSGTTVYFRPDPTIFPKVEFDSDLLAERLEIASYLHQGVKITFDDQVRKQKMVLEHHKGLVDYLTKIMSERSAKGVHETPFTLFKDPDGNGTGVRIGLVLQWTESTDEHLRSYVNGIPTGSGGTHESGLRAGLGKALRNFIETHNLSQRGVTITAEDLREGLIGHPEHVRPGSAVSRSDEGPPEQPGADVGRRLPRAPGSGTLAEPQQQPRGSDCGSCHPRRARAGSKPRGAAGGVAQERDVEPVESARQAQRLHVARRDGQ